MMWPYQIKSPVLCPYQIKLPRCGVPTSLQTNASMPSPYMVILFIMRRCWATISENHLHSF
uniref:Uncharacterized protein n=1 Tax=Nelumbo nucifera TaxID=4432 RepID=A0A822ZCV9_NELNU|nr:TPA_asm: hypothetical protein HUJ06_015834 [Nelumbo nucifera]